MENTQSIMIKQLAALLVAVFVVVMLAVPSFAYTDTSVNGVDFSDFPLPYSTSITPDSDAFIYGNNSGRDYWAYATTNTGEVYMFAVQQSNGFRLYFASLSQNQSVRYLSATLSGTSISLASSRTVNDTVVYFNTTDFTYNLNDFAVPLFSTMNEGFNALLDWIENPPVSSQPLSLALQPGNVAYIDITNTNATITLSQHTSVAYWQLTSTQYIGASNSLPSSGFTVPIAGTVMIDWVGVGRKTVQGQYNDWTSVNQISGSASDHQHVYAIVVNPLQNNITTGSGLDVSSVANGIINISVDPAWSVKIYQLENQFSLGVDSNTQSGDTGTGTYDSNTGQWNYTNDQTGESFEQQYGGMTTPESQFDSIHDFLENIANTISGFFSGAINAVSTLVGAGSSFFGVLGGLYSWLPPAVYSVLVSALIIVITIGVIKVFV